MVIDTVWDGMLPCGGRCGGVDSPRSPRCTGTGAQVDMGAGHFSASDRYKYLKERAFELAFVCDQLALPPKA